MDEQILNEAKSEQRRSYDAGSWITLLKLFNEGSKLNASIFRAQQFLEWSILRAGLLRDTDLKVLIHDKDMNNVRIVKDVDGPTIILQGEGETEKKIGEIITSYNQALKIILGEEMNGIVFFEELSKKSTAKVRTVLQVAQCFLYHPPGDSQWLTVVLNIHESVLDCLLFPGEMNGEKFKFFSDDPMRRSLMVGTVGMMPLSRQFDIDNDIKSRIVHFLSNSRNGEDSVATRRKNKAQFDVKKMPECLFRVPSLEGNCELDEGNFVELLDVHRDPLIRDRYSPASRPLFFSATIVSGDGYTYELKVIDGEEETTHHVHISEGLMYPVGTAERLGVQLRGEKADEKWRDMHDVGGPMKFLEEEWRGFAELLIDDEQNPYIRPIVIRNIHVGVLAEIAYVDSMESGSFLFPLSNPLLLPILFSKKSKLPVVFNNGSVNNDLLEEVLNEERKDRVTVITHNQLDDTRMASPSMNGSGISEDDQNPVPLTALDCMPASQILSTEGVFDERILAELDDMSGGGGGDSVTGTADEREQPEEKTMTSGEMRCTSTQSSLCSPKDEMERKEEEEEGEDELSVSTALATLEMDQSEEIPQSEEPLGDDAEHATEGESEEMRREKCQSRKEEERVVMKSGEIEESAEREEREERDPSDTDPLEEDSKKTNKIVKRSEVKRVVRRRGEMETVGRHSTVYIQMRKAPVKREEGEADESTLIPPSSLPIKRSLSTASSIELNASKRKRTDDISPSLTHTQPIGSLNTPSADRVDETGGTVEKGDSTVVAVMEEMVETVCDQVAGDASTPLETGLIHPTPIIPFEEKEGNKSGENVEEGRMDDLTDSSRAEEKEDGGMETALDLSNSPDASLKELNICKTGEVLVDNKEKMREMKDEKEEEGGMERKRADSPLIEVNLSDYEKREEREKIEKIEKRDMVEMVEMDNIPRDISITQLEGRMEDGEAEEETMDEYEEDIVIEKEKLETEKIEKTATETPIYQLARKVEDAEKDEREESIKMFDDGIPSGSSSNMIQSITKDEMKSVKETEKMTLDALNEDVPSKKIRLESLMKKEEKNHTGHASGRGIPLDPSFNPFELPKFQARAVTIRETPRVRGGFPRAPFVREAQAVNGEDERLISGDEELQRIQMEKVLKEAKLLRLSDKVIDKDVITEDLMSKFRNPLEWNSIEVQLFLDQLDVMQPLKDFVKHQDFDGMKIFKLTLNEIIQEFPHLGDDDFNEKIYFFGFIDKILKIASNPSIVFAPTVQGYSM